MQINKKIPSPKKALYFHFGETNKAQFSGILNKIRGKIATFKKFNIDFDLIEFKTKKRLYFNDQLISKLPSRNLYFRKILFNRILKAIKNNSYEFIYIRYFGSDKYFIQFLKKLHFKGIKVLLEFPTFPYDNEQVPKNFIEKRIKKNDIKYRPLLHQYVYKAISFTYRSDILQIPTIALENGIFLNNIPLIEPVHNENILNLIAVANVSKWHGIDRLINGLFQYYNTGEPAVSVFFKVVGDGKEINKLKHLVNELKLNSYVKFTGSKIGDSLTEEFKGMNLAIGSLGLHRLGLKEGSVLKLAEYTARAIPSVIGYKDLSISESVPFVLQISSDENPVEISALINFYNNMKSIPKEIRDFAEKEFTWDKQIKKIIEIL